MGIISSLARLRGPAAMAALGGGVGAASADPEDRLSGALTGAMIGGGGGMMLAPLMSGAGRAVNSMLPPPARLANVARQMGINPNTASGAAALRRVLLGQTGSAATQFPSKQQAQLLAQVRRQYPLATKQQIADRVLELMGGARDKVIEGVGDTAGAIGTSLSKGAGAVRRKAVQGVNDTMDGAGELGGKVVNKAAGGVNKVGEGVRSMIGSNKDFLIGGGALGGGGYMLMEGDRKSKMEQQGRFNMLKEIGLPPNTTGLEMLRQKYNKSTEDVFSVPPLPEFDDLDLRYLAAELNARMEAEKAAAAPRPKR